jgi:hypothetical protein
MRGSAEGPAGDGAAEAASGEEAVTPPLQPTTAALPMLEAERPPIPEDPLGTAQQGTVP